MMKITKKAKLKLVCPSKSKIELQMLIVIPSAPILQNPLLAVVPSRLTIIIRYENNINSKITTPKFAKSAM